jgi:hypothetical protein
MIFAKVSEFIPQMVNISKAYTKRCLSGLKYLKGKMGNLSKKLQNGIV